MDEKEKVSIQPASADESIPHLGTALDGYDDWYRDQVREGKAEAWRVTVDDRVSYAITRAEVDPKTQSAELVLCCYQGSDLVPFIEALKTRLDPARFTGIRCHVRRKGFERFARRLGFTEQERVYWHGLTV